MLTFETINWFQIVLGVSIFLIVFLTLSFFSSKQKFEVCLNGDTFTMYVGVTMFLPEKGPVTINGQELQVPQGGLWMEMTKKGELRSIPRKIDPRRHVGGFLD